MLKEIQNIENLLINSVNCGSSSKLFTDMMHKTSQWIDEINEKEVMNYAPIEKYVMPEGTAYKKYVITPDCMKDITDNIARLITNGNNLNVACVLAGYSYNILRNKFTPEHIAKFKRARELKYLYNN